MSDHLTVRNWITQKLPGHFDAATPQAAVIAAYEASDLADKMTVAEFQTALWSCGYQPKEIRAGLYRLILPDAKSPGVRARIYRE